MLCRQLVWHSCDEYANYTGFVTPSTLGIV